MKVLIACEKSQEVCKAFWALRKQWLSNGGKNENRDDLIGGKL